MSVTGNLASKFRVFKAELSRLKTSDHDMFAESVISMQTFMN